MTKVNTIQGSHIYEREMLLSPYIVRRSQYEDKCISKIYRSPIRRLSVANSDTLESDTISVWDRKPVHGNEVRCLRV